VSFLFPTFVCLLLNICANMCLLPFRPFIFMFVVAINGCRCSPLCGFGLTYQRVKSILRCWFRRDVCGMLVHFTENASPTHYACSATCAFLCRRFVFSLLFRRVHHGTGRHNGAVSTATALLALPERYCLPSALALFLPLAFWQPSFACCGFSRLWLGWDLYGLGDSSFERT